VTFGDAVTVTTCAFELLPPEFVAVSVTVYVPAFVNVIEGFCDVELVIVTPVEGLDAQFQLVGLFVEVFVNVLAVPAQMVVA
jgi:hypothetical protein